MNISQKIWITRKARIEAATRLERNDLLSQIYINYYSVFIVALSIWDLYKTDTNLSIHLVIGALLVLCTSIFISARNFKERALNTKNCYIKLDELYRKAEQLENRSSNVRKSDWKQLEADYEQLLLLSENHSIFDYLSFKHKLSKHDTEFKLSRLDIVYLFAYRIMKFIIAVGLFIIPLAILIWI